MARLQGKTAVVTGGSKGIGAAIAKSLAAEGASVIVNYASSREGADATVEAIVNAGGKAVAVQADVTDASQADALIAAARREFGGVDVVVNNSGVYAFAPIEEFDPAEYHRMFGVNVLGLLNVTKAAVPHLGQGASIINISSNITRMKMPGSALYTASKAAVDAITRVHSSELGPRQIRVNAISPGMTMTEGTDAAGIVEGSDFANQIIAQTPLGRVGHPDDIALAAVFLASDEARWITGEALGVSGGA
ncbi:SDR family NAD(P)-dependent oxidoreductase [Sphingosinithalassobacter portus]|uniref:SDR family NAD(P)-dependent oxidoreductase n=1 Tax=Stakelama portus TaxID=2676234 RepID=UPI000D6DE026|nr:glucose 1-dehydrogenase [Sphingosinithalassobacter portus]